MTISILYFPGTNREHDMASAFEHVSGKKTVLVWHSDVSLPPDTQCIIIPGGFSYGDYLRCGAMAGRAPIMKDVMRYAAKGVPILGVCNGFQILCDVGLLPGFLMRNADLSFKCRHQSCDIVQSYGWFDECQHHVTFPIAHGEGSYQVTPDEAKYIDDNNLVALRYTTNPNGSHNNIAGVFSSNKKILGMMPHPENAVFPWQRHHEKTDGYDFFASIAKHIL